MFNVTYHIQVVKQDIPKLSSTLQGRIKTAIEEKLETRPELYGKPLRRSLKGHRVLRVGDYRVMFRVQEHTIKIFLIAHRSVVYKQVAQRID